MLMRLAEQPSQAGSRTVDPATHTQPLDSDFRYDIINPMEAKMADQTPRGRVQDRSKVAAGQLHEVKYEAEKEGVSRGDVRDAVKDVGNSRKKVEERLENGE
jgi:hypothetical protein